MSNSGQTASEQTPEQAQPKSAVLPLLFLLVPFAAIVAYGFFSG